MSMSRSPYLDIPALDFQLKHNIEFYEKDNLTSLAKIDYTDNNGMHFGGTSLQTDVPVAYGAHTSVSLFQDKQLLQLVSCFL